MKALLCRLFNLQPVPQTPAPVVHECYFCGEELYAQQDKDQKCCRDCDLGNTAAYYPISR